MNQESDNEEIKSIESADGENLPSGEALEETAESQEELQTYVYMIPVDHNGTSLYLKGWVPSEAVHPPVVVIHDLGENIGMYASFAQKMAQRGYPVFGFDLRGHGRSGRLMGHVPSFDALVTDLLQICSWVKYKSDRQPPVIIAQGVGALVAMFFKCKFPSYASRCILMAPILSETPPLSPVYRALLMALAEIMPRFRLPRSATPQFIPVTELDDGEHRFQAITAHYAREVFHALNIAKATLHGLQGEFLMILPQQDVTYDFAAARELAREPGEHVKIDLLELGNIGLKPMIRNQEIDVALDSICLWLEEDNSESN